MSNGHRHHHHTDRDSGDARIGLAVALNVGLTFAQLAGGLIAGSLSLIADALHNFSDAIALIIAFAARRIARRPADGQMTFGYDRIEAVAALINYTTLAVVGLLLLYHAVLRFFAPEPVLGWIVVIVAGVALIVDLATVAFTYVLSKSSMNIRAAFLHNIADAASSVAVIVAGTLVILYGWNWVDPAATLLISGYVLWQVARETPAVVRILMLGSPPDMDTADVIGTIVSTPGVASAHHVHLWMMGEDDSALDAHVVLDHGASLVATRAAVKGRLARQHGLRHTTLEMEYPVDACVTAPQIGH